jgi:hypothetical protein
MSRCRVTPNNELERTNQQIGALIQEFLNEHVDVPFRLRELEEYVTKQCKCNGGTVGRTLRHRKRRGVSNYEVIGRGSSCMYHVRKVEPRTQLPLANCG